MTNSLKSLTLDDLRSRLRYDPVTGIFISRVRTKRRVGFVGGGGYQMLHIKGRIYLAHRIAWWLHFGEMPKGWLDHINGDRADNRIANIREASFSQNAQNVARKANNTSGYKGVSFSKADGKWRATICVNGRHWQLGAFRTPEEASRVYQLAAEKHFGSFAVHISRSPLPSEGAAA